MTLKKTINWLIPPFFKRWINIVRNLSCFAYDAKRFIIYSNAYYKNNTPNKLISQIIAEYHAIEKGLAMPQMRWGFGQKVLNDLVDHCNSFAKQFNRDDEQLIYAIRVMAEYVKQHEQNRQFIDEGLLKKIETFIAQFNIQYPSEQKTMSKQEYFSFSNSSFKEFSQSRHSVRNFNGSVDLNKVLSAIELAQNAPSSCNRQPIRVTLVKDKNLIPQILKLQNGNRGFGHLIDKLIIISGEVGNNLGINERNDTYINGGIYVMNLLYSLHYYKIGACTLNWSALPKDDLALRKLCNIPQSEIIIAIIACGEVSDNFKLVTSPRKNYQSILRII